MHMAEIFRMPTVPHSLILMENGKGKPAYITRRIDRSQKESRSLHMEDFCQLSGKLTEDKYRGSLENCVKIIKRYSSNTLLDVIGFFEITLFSFLTGNGDMHLKNFSLLYNEDGTISLAPAYDLLSTRLLIPEKLDSEEFALTMNGKKKKFTRNDFLKFGAGSGLSPRQIENCFKKFSASLGKAFDFIRASFLPGEIQDHYCDLVESRAERLGL
jgi:serine/threonine-protein kinase HipA